MSALARLRLLLLALVLPALAWAPEADALSVLGEQRTLVIPLAYQAPHCPDASPPPTCPAGVDQITPPRNSAESLRRVLQKGVNRHYVFGSYGRTRWNFRVVSSGASGGGFWPAPKNAQAYGARWNNFSDGGVVHDAVEVVLERAVRQRVISIAEVLRHDRLLVVVNWHIRGGQANGVAPVRYTVAGRTWAPTAAVLNEDSSDAALVSIAKHELGHQLFLDYDLYSTPCDPDGDRTLDPCACPNTEPGITPVPRLRDAPDCVGQWETMGFDRPGIGFSSFSRVVAGWIRPTDPWVRTEPVREFSDTVNLWPLSRQPVRHRASVLRLPRLTPDQTLGQRVSEAVLAAFNGRAQYTGYQAECRRPENDDVLIGSIGSPTTGGGVILSWIDETRGRNKPQYVVRTDGAQDYRQALLETGESYQNATTGLFIAMRGFAPDGSCIVDVNYDPPRLSNLAAPVSPDVTRLAGRLDLFGDRGSTAMFMAGGVSLGDKRLQPEPPERGRRHTVRFGYLNNGQVAASAGQAQLRVSQPYAAAPSCGGAALPLGKVEAKTALAPLAAGTSGLASLQWGPGGNGSTGLTIELDSPGDAVAGDNVLTSAFAFQTHRQRRGAEESKVRLLVPEACGEAQQFDLSPVALPRGWRLRVRGAEKLVAAGESRQATVVLRAPPGARPGTVAIPVVVRASGRSGPGQIVGGLDILAAVVRGNQVPDFRLPASSLRRPPREPGRRFPLPPADPALGGTPAATPTPAPTPTATPTPTPSAGASAIALSCPSGTKSGDPVPIAGEIEPPHAATVTLRYAEAKGQSQTTDVTAGGDGRFSDTFKSQTPGSWTLTASWPGDGDHSGASGICSFTVG